MSRFLARALSLVAREADASAALPVASTAKGFGGFGDFGERAGGQSRPPPDAAAPPGLVAVVAVAELPPWCPPGPIVPLYPVGAVVTPDPWLNRLAGNLARAMAEGAKVRPCPFGGLDLERPCGRRLWVSGEHVREMRLAGLLHFSPDE